MSTPAPKAPPAPAKKAPAKAKKEGEDKPKATRSRFSEIYPDDAKVEITTPEGANPKRPGSKAHEVFELYRTNKTVGEFLAAGGNYNDIAYNVGRNFIKVG